MLGWSTDVNNKYYNVHMLARQDAVHLCANNLIVDQSHNSTHAFNIYLFTNILCTSLHWMHENCPIYESACCIRIAVLFYCSIELSVLECRQKEHPYYHQRKNGMRR